MSNKPSEHKPGEYGRLGPEHFDGDPIERELTPEGRAQADKLVDGVVKNAMPKNAVQKPVNPKPRK